MKMNKKGQGYHQFSFGADFMIFLIGVIVGLALFYFASQKGILPF